MIGEFTIQKMNPFYFFKVQKSLKILFYIGSNNCIVKLSPPPSFQNYAPLLSYVAFKKCELFLSGFLEICFPEGQDMFLTVSKIPTPHAYKSPKYRDAGLTISLAVTHHHLVLPWNSSWNCVVSSHCFLSHLRHETTGKESHELIRYLLLSSWNLPLWFRQ